MKGPPWLATVSDHGELPEEVVTHGLFSAWLDEPSARYVINHSTRRVGLDDVPVREIVRLPDGDDGLTIEEATREYLGAPDYMGDARREVALSVAKARNGSEEDLEWLQAVDEAHCLFRAMDAETVASKREQLAFLAGEATNRMRTLNKGRRDTGISDASAAEDRHSSRRARAERGKEKLGRPARERAARWQARAEPLVVAFLTTAPKATQALIFDHLTEQGIEELPEFDSVRAWLTKRRKASNATALEG